MEHASIRPQPWRLQPVRTTVAAALVVALAGCGQQQPTPPAPVAAAVPAAQPALQTAAQPALQTAATAPVVATPAPAGTTVPAAQSPQVAGRPVPLAPADGPNPPVAYAPVPVQPVPQQVQPAPARVAAESARPAVASNRIGRVSSIEPIRERPSGTGAGGVVGGLLGAVVGNQFGHGNGRTALTVLGAAGGAVAGNNVERNVRERVVGYRVAVHLDNGEVRSFQEQNAGDLQVGDRVRVDGQRLRRL